MSTRLDPHAELRRRYQIVKRYWRKRGVRPDERNEVHFSLEMEREALAAHDAEMAAQATPDAPAPEPELPSVPPSPVEFVEPGTGELRVAILCPGPSLPEVWPKGERLDGYDLVLAVNNAAAHAPCEWWVAQDPGPLKDYEGRPTVGILTNGAQAETLNGDRSFYPNGMTDADLDRLHVLASNKMTHAKAPRRAGWSTTNAIILAARLGAREIDLFGDDKSGNRYFDGVENKGTKKSRWERELRDQSDLCERLESAGVTVRNIRPEPETEADS